MISIDDAIDLTGTCREENGATVVDPDAPRRLSEEHGVDFAELIKAATPQAALTVDMGELIGDPRMAVTAALGQIFMAGVIWRDRNGGSE